jgi:hypothetical protein
MQKMSGAAAQAGREVTCALEGIASQVDYSVGLQLRDLFSEGSARLFRRAI